MRPSPILIAALLAGCQTSDDQPDIVPIKDPTEFGPTDVEWLDFELMLEGRTDGFAARVPARLHVPRRASEDLPVVIFSHGFSVRPDEYFDLLNHVASWGWAVVAPQWDGGFTNSRTHAGLAQDVGLAMDWMQENGLPRDELEGVEGLEKVTFDTSAFALVGHSRGGKQSFHAASEDDRVSAVLGLDPVDSLPPVGDPDPEDYPSVAPELIRDLGVPATVVGFGRGAEGTIPCAPEGEAAQAFFDALPNGATLFSLPTAGHNDIVDACAEGEGGLACSACPAGDDPSATRRFAMATTVAFLGLAVDEDRGFEAWMTGTQFTELLDDATRTIQGGGTTGGADTDTDAGNDTDTDTDG